MRHPTPPGRRALLLGALLAPAACAAAAPGELARPVPLALPLGAALRPLGALAIDTALLGFGGLSGLHLAADGRIAAVSDRGFWLTARLLWDGARPVGLGAVRTGPLRDGAGNPLPGYARDAEALARLPDGTWLVAYERWHRIRAHAGGLDAPGRYLDAPAALAQAPANGGIEALAVLPDGRWLLIAERHLLPDAPGLRRAWLGRPGRGWLALGYRPAGGMDPVDATPLPDGGVLVLERSFSLLGGFGGRLVRLPAAALAAAGPGAVLAPEEPALLRLAPPLPVDNYEGVAAARIGGRTVVLLVSDDNENTLQRTWLLVLALPEG